MPSTLSDPFYRAFVAHLVRLRHARGVHQEDLAARLGKPQSYVSKTERFYRRMTPAEFVFWVSALGADPVEEFAAVVRELAEAGA